MSDRIPAMCKQKPFQEATEKELNSNFWWTLLLWEERSHNQHVFSSLQHMLPFIILLINVICGLLAAPQCFTVSGPTGFVFLQPDKDLDSSPLRALPGITHWLNALFSPLRQSFCYLLSFILCFLLSSEMEQHGPIGQQLVFSFTFHVDFLQAWLDCIK